MSAPTVYKFGGTSLADAERLRHVAGLVRSGPRHLVVVVSAGAGVTDALAEAAATGEAVVAAEILRGLEERHLGAARALGGDVSLEAAVSRRLASTLRELDAPASAARTDAVLSTGEDLSALLLAAAIGAGGAAQPARAARTVDARTVVRTDARFGAGIPQAQTIRTLAREHLAPVTRQGTVAVVQGFVGATADGRTTTLGRGGSDFTAALLGGAMDAPLVHIWTDVDGVLSGDPGIVAHPRLLEEAGFEETVELAWSGARVLHPVAAKWAVSQGVPLRIRNTFRPEHPGTLVRNDRREASQDDGGLAAVTAKPGVALIAVRSRPWAMPYGFLARVFGVLGRHRLEVDLVATSHSSTAFTIDASQELGAVVEELETFAEVRTRTGLTTVTVVGRGLLARPRENARVFRTLEDIPIHLISQASDVSVSLVVDEEHGQAAVGRLHQALLDDEEARRREEVRRA